MLSVTVTKGTQRRMILIELVEGEDEPRLYWNKEKFTHSEIERIREMLLGCVKESDVK